MFLPEDVGIDMWVFWVLLNTKLLVQALICQILFYKQYEL